MIYVKKLNNKQVSREGRNMLEGVIGEAKTEETFEASSGIHRSSIILDRSCKVVRTYNEWWQRGGEGNSGDSRASQLTKYRIKGTKLRGQR